MHFTKLAINQDNRAGGEDDGYAGGTAVFPTVTAPADGVSVSKNAEASTISIPL